MNALTLGLIAALSWGLHDFFVRFIGQKIPVGASILSVLIIGLAFQFALTIGTGNLAPVPHDAVGQMLGAGAFLVVANWGLYGSFQRGPVWLAAPLVACFSILSVGLAVFQGAYISAEQWLAVLAILGGIMIISMMSSEPETEVPSKGLTVVYGLVAAVGFAGTFAFGQAATELSNEMLSALVTRSVAIAIMVVILLAFRLPVWPGRKNLGILALMGLADCIAILSVVSAGGLPNTQYAAVATSMYGLPAIWLTSVFLNEHLNRWQWLGCLVVFFGVGYLAFVGS